jgi:eukaryotic-like serine/threonine-protein kinase
VVDVRTQWTRIGTRYELRERLGGGGMGEVFAAYDTRLDRDVAIKLLRSDLAGTPAMRARIAAEARVAARIHHPNVVAVLDAGSTEDGHAFLVMERLSGRTLRDELAGGAMHQEHVRELGRQILGGLAAAHALDVVHRDVKPGNVLQGPQETWKVADFGIAKWLLADETVTATGEVLGSPAYLAPERLAGHAATPASDVYAAGVVLYEALAGRRPFDGDDPFAIAMAAREGRAESLSSLRPEADPALVAVIEHAIAVDPSMRWPSAAAFRDALTDRTSHHATLTVPLRSRADVTATTPFPPAATAGRVPGDGATATTPMHAGEAPTGVLPPPTRPRPRSRPLLVTLVVFAVLLAAGAVSAGATRNDAIAASASPANDPGIDELGSILAPPEEPTSGGGGGASEDPPAPQPAKTEGSGSETAKGDGGNGKDGANPKGEAKGHDQKGDRADKPGKGPKD